MGRQQTSLAVKTRNRQTLRTILIYGAALAAGSLGCSGGVIRFGTTLLLGLGISAVASLIYAIGWEICLAYGNFDFADFYSKMMIDAARAKGVTEAELQKVIVDAQSFVTMYRNPLFRIPITFIEMFPVGILISLISAALLRNPRLLPARVAG